MSTPLFIDPRGCAPFGWGSTDYAVPFQSPYAGDLPTILATVREAYAPFDVLVTADPPPAPCLTVLLVQPFPPFTDYAGLSLRESPIHLVFPPNLADVKSIALCCIHEFGHGLDLWDAGFTDAAGKWVWENGNYMGDVARPLLPRHWGAADFATLAGKVGLRGDWNHDGRVDILDLNRVLATYGQPGGTTIFDLNAVLANYGRHG